MSTRIDPSSGQVRLLVLMGLGLWLLAGVAEIWEVLAVQSPDSPFHLGVLSGPIGQLRAHSFGLGSVCVGLAWTWPMLFSAGSGWPLLGTFLSGALLEIAALLWAASSGMLAVQVFDPRPDARLMLYARALGHGLCLLSGFALLVRGLRTVR